MEFVSKDLPNLGSLDDYKIFSNHGPYRGPKKTQKILELNLPIESLCLCTEFFISYLKNSTTFLSFALCLIAESLSRDGQGSIPG